MIKKFMLVAVATLFLAACGSTEGRKSAEMVKEGRWYAGFISLGKYMEIPESSEFQDYATAATSAPDFAPSFSAEFERELSGAIARTAGITRADGAQELNAMGKALTSLEISGLMPRGNIDAMRGNWDQQMATAYQNGQMAMGLDEAPSRTRALPIVMVQNPNLAHRITWDKVKAGDMEALDKMLQISKDVAANGNSVLDTMTRTVLTDAKLPFPAWSNHVARHYPSLAAERMNALETRLVAEFDFQNRMLGYQMRTKLATMAPDVKFVEAGEEAEGTLMIRELMFQTQGPMIKEDSKVLGANYFGSGFKKSYPNIYMVGWRETETQMSGQWAVQLELRDPDGKRVSERMTQGEKSEKAVICSDPKYYGKSEYTPSGWPVYELEKRCANKDVPVTRADYFQDIAIQETLNAALGLLGGIRKVDDPAMTGMAPASGQNSWNAPPGGF